MAVRTSGRRNHAVPQPDVSMDLLAGFPMRATAALIDGQLHFAIQFA